MKVFLWINAVVFLIYGLCFIALPEMMSQLVTGTVPDTTSGLTDMRATYGGMSLGFGVLLAYAAQSSHLKRFGVLCVVFIMMGMTIARTLGMLIDGSPNENMYIYLALELLVSGLGARIFFKTKK